MAIVHPSIPGAPPPAPPLPSLPLPGPAPCSPLPAPSTPPPGPARPRTPPCAPPGTLQVGNLGVGALAGTLAATVCYPLDTIRRRMQVGGSGAAAARLVGAWWWGEGGGEEGRGWGGSSSKCGKVSQHVAPPPPGRRALPRLPPAPCTHPATPSAPVRAADEGQDVQQPDGCICDHLAHRGGSRLLPGLVSQHHQGGWHPPSPTASRAPATRTPGLPASPHAHGRACQPFQCPPLPPSLQVVPQNAIRMVSYEILKQMLGVQRAKTDT
jgi:hypothetical protein